MISDHNNVTSRTKHLNVNHQDSAHNGPIIVTSALPYANGEIHLGHISSTYLPADIFTRYLKLLRKEVFYICATDDFGTPILINAEKEGKTPGQFVEYWNKRDLEDFKSLGISFDKFYKTSSEENKKFVQYVFNILKNNGYIYENEVIQFYCEFDKKFLPDRYVLGTCPYCNSKEQYSDICEKCGRVPQEILDPKCGICGNPPIKRKSNHYFFKLSHFNRDLKNWLCSNNNLQTDVKKYVMNWIDDGLQDWDITRDLSWGISIPLDSAKGKVFYGWFDNHLCYISTFLVLINELENSQLAGKQIWNNAKIYHFIGKDIIYHHFLFLPAIRIGMKYEYKLPDYIPVRGHLMLHNKKISKSRNWFISLKEFITLFNPDYLRFYITSISLSNQDDINFDWDSFYNKINNELVDNIGNFVNRTLSFTARKYDRKVPAPANYDRYDNESIQEIVKTVAKVGKLLLDTQTDKALKAILLFSNYFNQYFQKKEPWSNNSTSSTTIFISVNAVRTLAILLQPFIPNSASYIWSQLGFNTAINEELWDTASELKITPGHQIGLVVPLFKKIDKSIIETEKTKLRT